MGDKEIISYDFKKLQGLLRDVNGQMGIWNSNKKSRTPPNDLLNILCELIDEGDKLVKKYGKEVNS